MTVPPSEIKRRLRRELLAALDNLSPSERARGSQALCQRLAGQQAWQCAEVLMMYAPMPAEPDINPLLSGALRAGKTVLLPRFSPLTGHYELAQVQVPERDLQPGKMGILEPGLDCPKGDPNRLDLALVPGVGFDALGGRLGRGRGFLDRLLAPLPGLKCGVAFDCQITADIPCQAHDVRMHYLVTPTRWLACSAGLIPG